MKLTLAALAIALTAGSALATSVNVPVGQRVGPAPTGAATGLNGMGYFKHVNDIPWADMWISQNTANFTYMTSRIDQTTSEQVGTVSSFLDFSTMITPPAAGNQSNADTIYKYTGFIAIQNPGQYDFKVLSDDGFRLKIGGQTIAEFIGSRDKGETQGWATFAQAGLYPIEIVYFNGGGEADLQIKWTNAGNPGGFHVLGSVNNELYKIPAPGAAALLGLGGLTIARRRRTR
jgi:hypothetical protein